MYTKIHALFQQDIRGLELLIAHLKMDRKYQISSNPWKQYKVHLMTPQHTHTHPTRAHTHKTQLGRETSP